jgi:hypothetical protein
MREDIERKVDKMADKVDKLGESIQGLRNEVYNSRNQSLKWVLSSLISFLLGGGAFELVKLLIGKP